MTTLIGRIIDGYNDLMKLKDPRTDQYLLMSSPAPTLIICAVYIYFVKSLGPRLMKDRKPYELKNVIIAYNIAQVAVSVYIVYKGLIHAWLWRYSYTCQPVSNYYVADKDEEWIVYLCWLYYMCKFTEFLDTIFFVLRKKFDQITHLHVIHHSIMPACVWWGVKFLPSGHGTFFGLINTFVHVIMYTYYLLAAMGPQYQKYLWWKKHLTTIQMIQFVMVFLHTSQMFFNGCNYPRVPAIVLCFWALTFLGLFSNFYIQAYIKRRRLPAVKKIESNGNSESIHHDGSKSLTYSQMASNAMVNAAKACYIGQNGLMNQEINVNQSTKNKRSKSKKDM